MKQLHQVASKMSAHINEAAMLGVIDEETKMQLHQQLDEIVAELDAAYES